MNAVNDDFGEQIEARTQTIRVVTESRPGAMRFEPSPPRPVALARVEAAQATDVQAGAIEIRGHVTLTVTMR